MSDVKEINLGYLDHVRNLNKGGASPSKTPESPSLRLRFGLWRYSILNTYILPAFRLTGLVTVGLVLDLWLRLNLLFKRSKPSKLTTEAVDSVDEFVEQYPLHLFAIVCKAFELAFLSDELSNMLEQDDRIVELAIGEGTLSARVFPRDVSVVGLDLIPYSLKKAELKDHVKQAIVCDCMTPPIRPGSFDLLVANNFLHHITNKEKSLAVWSRIADKAFFNENTPYFASAWTRPYMLEKLGRKQRAAEVSAQIERHLNQCLKPQETLDTIVNKDYEIKRRVTFFSARTFFYCSLFSYIFGCYGAPTPLWIKKLSQSKLLHWLIIPLTSDVAKLLIRFDQNEDRARDTFISYSCKSRNYVPETMESYLACPDCGAALNLSNQCAACAREYTSDDGMLFLLPQGMKDLQHEYSHELSARTPAEHL
ncbi:MAG TPA: methyltransferase domain-containing protein [Pyrinomonadaceae bacterium]|nr:methyltransferase domain-containing protein [Pyrinomonadaceae bacterium]